MYVWDFEYWDWVICIHRTKCQHAWDFMTRYPFWDHWYCKSWPSSICIGTTARISWLLRCHLSIKWRFKRTRSQILFSSIVNSSQQFSSCCPLTVNEICALKSLTFLLAVNWNRILCLSSQGLERHCALQGKTKRFIPIKNINSTHWEKSREHFETKSSWDLKLEKFHHSLTHRLSQLTKKKQSNERWMRATS